MTTAPLEARVELVNDKIKFTGTAKSNPPITIDYVPPVGGGEGYMSLELLLLSLASCSGSSVALLLRRMRKTVVGLTVTASGVRRETHPTAFTRITLEFQLKSPDAQGTDVEKALALSEETLCPVWAMLKNNVEIATRYSIVAQ